VAHLPQDRHPRLINPARAGFTLVELLTVTAVISILASIIGVALGNAKGAAKTSTCLFNLRQMAIGVNTYLQDYDDTYPQTKVHGSLQPAVDDANGSLENPDRGSLLNALGSETTGIADCPSDPDPDDVTCSMLPGARPGVNSYSVNAYFIFGLNQGQIANGVASTILAAERRNSYASNGAPPNCDVSYHPWFNTSNPEAPQNDMDAVAGALDTQRHAGGSNYMFADGHAGWNVWAQTYAQNRVNLHLPY
jgi:prepilin-type N-terminal cleavage/methylation domain-containing protein/prepilin-type processing-associated H-X9-DG protein